MFDVVITKSEWRGNDNVPLPAYSFDCPLCVLTEWENLDEMYVSTRAVRHLISIHNTSMLYLRLVVEAKDIADV